MADKKGQIGNHAKRCMNEKTIQCLSNPSQHIPIYLEQFPSYSSRKCKKSQFSRTAAHIFVSPGDAPAIFTQCVAWMERQFNACQTSCSMYPSTSTVSKLFEPQVQKIAIFTYGSPHFCFPWGRSWGNHAKCCMNGKRIRCLRIVSQYVPIYLQQFPSYSNPKFKKTPFSRTAAHIFVSPGDTPAIITQYVAWMERQFNACQTPRSMYLSIFNSFRVIRWLSQCVSPKIAIFTTLIFLFSLGTPLGQSR